MDNFRCITLMRKLSLVIIIMALIIVLPMLASCGGEKAETTITIGYLTRLNPVFSSSEDWTLQAFGEMVKYYNEHKIIPDTQLEFVYYTGPYDYTGENAYKQLRDDGVDLIFTPSFELAESVKPLADHDKIILFTPATINEEDLQLPGYVFCIDSLPRYQAHILLEWIATSDPDFPSNRPARIGGTSYNSSYAELFLMGLEEYANANPSKYEWIGSDIYNEFPTDWDSQLDLLRDCDY